MKRIVVLGNGFDIDLGLKTKYTDFLRSEVYKKHLVKPNDVMIKQSGFDERYTHNLFNYFAEQNRIQKSTWGGIESSLFELSRNNGRCYTIKGTRIGEKIVCHPNDYDDYLDNSFSLIKKVFMEYLNCLDYSRINEESNAYKLFYDIAFDTQTEIITFNYTSLSKLTKKDIVANIHHIHGSLEEGWIILGYQPTIDHRGEYVKMEKSNDPHWQDNKLFEKLKKADEIVFFGLSFADSDMWYFEDFFKAIARGSVMRKRVVLYCYSLNSFGYIHDRIQKVCNYNDFVKNVNLETKFAV